MLSVLIIFFGTFWESSMDILSMKHSFERSAWKLFADYFDKRGISKLGNKFWDNSFAWTNKWKNNDPTQGERFFGSSWVFVTLMDGWHLVKFFWLLHVFGAIVFYRSFTSYWVFDICLLYGAFGLGHEIFGYLLKVKRL